MITAFLPPPSATELAVRCQILVREIIAAKQPGVRDVLTFILSDQLDLLKGAMDAGYINNEEGQGRTAE
ncbi:hypothetical protein WP05_15930 [Salmonella enterica subsp. arizonae]|uniref:Uncharacterized protein n=1 Tax=Salmonella enteritidis TaxID=149539 RepID=A0A403FGM3_SALEN|nr:hypothetical protein [Salmonella enterica subsp. diarizonae]EED4923768.1 hypothetical protein [Salmonella enterica subsp. arizonae]MJY19092.1 hypothetical protein [Salmonella enterica subsp. enterica serovar Enteritidis]